MPKRLFYPATERNREPILQVLKSFVPANGQFLEIASGSGEHIIHFAKHYPHAQWQPTDIEQESLNSIQAWIDHEGATNINPPAYLDCTKDTWDFGELDGAFCINMIHISPWEATLGLMDKVGKSLKKDGFLYLYGPYKVNGQHTAPSNESFEGWLKDKDERFGVRDLEKVEQLALENGLRLKEKINMPANNFSLVFSKT